MRNLKHIKHQHKMAEEQAMSKLHKKRKVRNRMARRSRRTNMKRR